MSELKFKQNILYKVLYTEGDNIFKSPQGYITGYDLNFIQLTFPDGLSKLVNVKSIISISEIEVRG